MPASRRKRGKAPARDRSVSPYRGIPWQELHPPGTKRPSELYILSVCHDPVNYPWVFGEYYKNKRKAEEREQARFRREKAAEATLAHGAESSEVTSSTASASSSSSSLPSSGRRGRRGGRGRRPQQQQQQQQQPQQQQGESDPSSSSSASSTFDPSNDFGNAHHDPQHATPGSSSHATVVDGSKPDEIHLAAKQLELQELQG